MIKQDTHTVEYALKKSVLREERAELVCFLKIMMCSNKLLIMKMNIMKIIPKDKCTSRRMCDISKKERTYRKAKFATS